jgi:hypothetical protein
MVKEIDAAHILSSYSAAWLKRNDVVQDVQELPYSKEAIKAVLIHCIKLTEPGTEREFLRNAYVSLADFQPLSDAERGSLKIWERIGRSDPLNLGGEDISKLAKDISNLGKAGQAAHKRATEEAAALLEELKLAGL